MNTVIEVSQPALRIDAQHLLQFCDQCLATRQFEKRLLFLDHRIVFSRDALKCIEIAWRDHLTEDTGIQKPRLIDHFNLRSQAPHQSKSSTARRSCVMTY